MKATTASLRKQAQQHESRREWMEARSCWLEAIRLYPAGRGSLRGADILNMSDNAERCLDEFRRATDPAAQWVAKRDRRRDGCRRLTRTESMPLAGGMGIGMG